MRESAVMVLEDVSDIDEETGKIMGWEADPYDPTHEANFMANKADAAIYDGQFSEHPLSRLRGYLDDIRNNIEIDSELYELKPFVYGAGSNERAWWKFWG